jgi:hypothetical protein
VTASPHSSVMPAPATTAGSSAIPASATVGALTDPLSTFHGDRKPRVGPLAYASAPLSLRVPHAFLSGGRNSTAALAWLRSSDRNEATEVWTVAASSSSAPSFADLTSAGQTRRLRRLALSALEAYEVSVCGLVHGTPRSESTA